MAQYYAQRASAGLLISEATQISPQGAGYPSTPGMHSADQVSGWRLVTEAVHSAGGRIFAQLWHVGRVSHSAYQPGGALPVSSSAVAPAGLARLPDGTQAPRPTPKALTIDEIAGIMHDYTRAAENARAAGFDGVELHGANGYLPDQFIRDSVNRRTDIYGGSVENRARFHLEATEALVRVFGPGRVGVRLSPSGTFGDVRDSDPRGTFGYLVTELGRRYGGGLAYIHVMEAMRGDGTDEGKPIPGYAPIPAAFFRPMFKGALVTNSGFTFEKSQTYLREGWADAVAFGTAFIANPDLPARFAAMARGQSVPLNEPNPATFYSPGPEGYTDYPTLDTSSAVR
jgi:N-ethylmaleimide reductase